MTDVLDRDLIRTCADSPRLGSICNVALLAVPLLAQALSECQQHVEEKDNDHEARVSLGRGK